MVQKTRLWQRLQRALKRINFLHKSKRDVEQQAGIEDLPRELMDNVVDHLLATDGPTAAHTLSTLRSVNTAFRNYIDSAQIMHQAHVPKLARDIFVSTYPEAGLDELPNDIEASRVGAGQRVAAIAPILHFLSQATADRVIRDIGNLQHPMARAQAIASLARSSDFGALSRAGRNFLIDEGIRGFGVDGPDLTTRRSEWASALAHMHRHMSPSQNSKLALTWQGRPRLKRMFDRAVKRVKPRDSNPIKNNAEKIAKIAALNKSFNDVPMSASDFTRVQRMTEIATDLSESFTNSRKNNRNELLDKDRTGAGRAL